MFADDVNLLEHLERISNGPTEGIQTLGRKAEMH